jgi:predicted NBD/HSP70 family sugar kinase
MPVTEFTVPIPAEVRIEMSIRYGIDLGGTKIELIALDREGREVLRQRVPTPAKDYLGTLTAIVAMIAEARLKTGARGRVGIGTPGAVSAQSGRIKNANSTTLNGQRLKEDLEGMLGGEEIRIANDANCFALSEAHDGAGAGARVVFGVILGTGVGGGIVINGQVLTGANAIAGEWGHNPLPLPRDLDLPLPVCYCGSRGCIETYLSGPNLARDHREQTREVLTPEHIAACAALNDRNSAETMKRYEKRLARALAGVINILDPDVIVLGGGLSNIASLYENVPRYWGPYVMSDTVETRLLRNRHGDSSGVRGAAWLWTPAEAEAS